MKSNKKKYAIENSLCFSFSLFVILIVLKTKLYFNFSSYIFSSGSWLDVPSILFSDFLFALIILSIFYLLNRVLKPAGIFFVVGIYSSIIVFSVLSTITYLRLGAPINAGMLRDIKYDFLRSSIEQQTDIKLLFTKLIIIICFGLILPHLLKRFCRNLFRKYIFYISFSVIILSLFFPAYLKANRLSEPDLWKTPIQSFIHPIWIEYKTKANSNKVNKDFTFISPFISRMLTKNASISLPVRNYNVVIYLMEGVPSKLMNEIIQQGRLPNVEKMLANSINLTNYYTTAADSTKGIFSILTSMYPFPGKKKITNVTNNLEYQTLPKILKKNCYSTAIISSGSFAWDHTKYFFEKNFEIAIDRNKNANQKKYISFSWGLDDQFMVDQLEKVLSSNQGPYFIILVASNSHHPYLTPDKKYNFYTGTDPNNKLKNAICYQDNIIGKINQVFKKRGIADNTITILTSDHSIRYNYDMGNKRGKPQISPGEEQSAIPFIIHNPAIKENTRSNFIGSHLDTAPTILNMLGIKIDKQFQGIDLFKKNNQRRVHFIVSNYKSFNIILRDAEFQYFYDITNNREAIRHMNLTSDGKEYLPEDFYRRSIFYKKLCIEFIEYQKEYLKKLSKIHKTTNTISGENLNESIIRVNRKSP